MGFGSWRSSRQLARLRPCLELLQGPCRACRLLAGGASPLPPLHARGSSSIQASCKGGSGEGQPSVLLTRRDKGGQLVVSSSPGSSCPNTRLAPGAGAWACPAAAPPPGPGVVQTGPAAGPAARRRRPPLPRAQKGPQGRSARSAAARMQNGGWRPGSPWGRRRCARRGRALRPLFGDREIWLGEWPVEAVAGAHSAGTTCRALDHRLCRCSASKRFCPRTTHMSVLAGVQPCRNGMAPCPLGQLLHKVLQQHDRHLARGAEDEGLYRDLGKCDDAA